MAEAAFTFAIETLGNFAIEKVCFLLDVEERVEWLKCEFETMQCFLRDAAEKQAKHATIRQWISTVREVAFNAEDAIESFSLTVDEPRKRRGILKNWACFPVHVYHLNKLGDTIESIKRTLEDIHDRCERYKIPPLSDAPAVSRDAVQQRRLVAPWLKDTHKLVDLEGRVESILSTKIYQKKEKGLCITGIFGMGGIGKSALAKEVYNRATTGTNTQFDNHAWVTVSSDFNTEDVFKKLVEQLKPRPGEQHSNIEKMLHERLKGTQYFIVLDDVWRQRDLDRLGRALPSETDKESRLLITSRRTDFQRVQPYELNHLTNDESKELFQQIAFSENKDSKHKQKFQQIGNELVETCQGVPLAIIVMAGLLSEQRESVSGWKMVKKAMESHLEEPMNDIDIGNSILELSYLDLPPHLKSCFLCLCFFKEDALIDAKTLIQLWVAEGIVPKRRAKGGMTMEERARSYLDELINRNMVQIDKLSKDGQVKYCRVHDLLRDLCIMKAKEEIHFDILCKENTFDISLDKTRHLVMCCNNESSIPHLRSLFLHVSTRGDDCIQQSFWENLEGCLRVLELGSLELTMVPKIIGTLIGLKFLGLRDNQIKKLPKSLGDLTHLQTLDISGNRNVEVPNIIWKLGSLRHLYMPLDIICKEPLKLDTLKNLQTLLVVSTKNFVLEHLAKMIGLQELNLELSAHDAKELFPLLAKLERLVSLGLTWSPGHVLSLDGIANLQRLTVLHISGKVKELPQRLPENLSYLKMSYTFLNTDPMPLLGKLPNLLCLKLFLNSYVGEEMTISHNDFPTLKVLSFVYLPKVRQINIKKGGLAETEELEISDCPHLKIVPEVQDSGMRYLKEPKISDTSTNESNIRFRAIKRAVSLAMEMLDDQSIQKVSSLLKVDTQVTKLKSELQLIQPFLNDATKKQAHDKNVRQWISDVGEVALDTTDVLEFFTIKAGSPSRSRQLLGQSASFPGDVYHLYRLRQEVESILKKIKVIAERREWCGIEYLEDAPMTELSSDRIDPEGIQNLEEAPMTQLLSDGTDPHGIQELKRAPMTKLSSDGMEPRRGVSSSQPDKYIIGLQEDVDNLLHNAILVEERGLFIASIVGRGGIGKSTLAKIVYNHQVVIMNYDCRAWVTVSFDFNPRKLLVNLLQQLNPRVDEETIMKNPPETALIEMLHKFLWGRPYFIVLDDVGREEDWEWIRRALPDGVNKSRLLITSRNSNIGTQYVHKLKALNTEDSWQLFLRATSLERRLPPELENIGQRIAQECNGLPLAIRATAGLLQQEMSVARWKRVLNEFTLSSPPLAAWEGKMSHFLESSYRDLSLILRSCFLYLSFYKGDARIDARMLIQLWIAEGIILQQSGEVTLEEGAENCLEDLGKQSFFEGIKLSKDEDLGKQSIFEGIKLSKDGKIKSFQIIDKHVWDLCVNKAKEEILFDMLSTANTFDQSLDNARHLVINYNNESFMLSRSPIPHIRSLFLRISAYGDDCIPTTFWERLGGCLRVLELGGLGLTMVPERIGSLIGLKYLGLRNNKIRELPRSLGQLYLLQTLDISGNKDVDVSNVIWKLESLRHLYMPMDIICKNGLKLDTLKNLQTLAIVSPKNIVVKHLAKLVSLRKLKLELTTDVDVNELLATLAKLEHLFSMGLSWSLEHELSLDGIVNLQHLKQFHIFGKLANLPNFPESLSYLKLRDINLKENSIPILGKIPKLLHLKLVGDSYDAEKMVMRDGFPQLKILNVCGQKKLKEIYIENAGSKEFKLVSDYKDIKIIPEKQKERLMIVSGI